MGVFLRVLGHCGLRVEVTLHLKCARGKEFQVASLLPNSQSGELS